MFLSRCHTPSKMGKHDAFVGQFGRTKPTGENAPVPAQSAHSWRKEVRSRVGNGGFDVAHAPQRRSLRAPRRRNPTEIGRQFGRTKPTGENAPVPAESAHFLRKEVRSRVGNGGFDVAHAPCKRSRHVDLPAGSTSNDIHINLVDHGRPGSRLYERPRREPRGQRRSRRCPPYDVVLPQFWRNEASAFARHMLTLSARSLAERSQQVRTLRSRPSQRTPREKRCAVGWATAASTLPTRLASAPAPSIHQRARAATTFISVRSIMEDPFRGSMIGHAASRKGCAAG